MTALPCALLLFAGLAALSLSMQRHARQVFVQGQPPLPPRPLRALGWALLAASLALRLVQPGWRVGIVEWAGLCGAAAACVVLTLLYRPRALPVLAVTALAVAALVPALLLAALA